MAGNVTDRDKGYKKRLKILRDAASKQHAVTVGVHEEEGAEKQENSDLTIAELATIHEMGATSVGIPERSFIRNWFDENEAENAKVIQKLAEATAQGKIESLDVALDQAGAKFAADVKKGIIGNIPPPNAEATIARKGTSTPLIGETTQLLSSITWKVEK